MAQILILEDDEPIRALVAEILGRQGHDVVPFEDATAALAHLGGQTVELIIADIDMPHMNGFQFRDALKNQAATAQIPFMFLTGAGDPAMQSELATRMADEVVVFKPINRPAFRRIVQSMIGQISREDGELTLDALLAVFRKAEHQNISGVLTVYEGETSKKVFFDGGRLVFVIGNDPTEFIGQSLVREGLVSEQGLARLFEARGNRGVPLGEVFLSKAADKADILQELLERKIRDAVLDLFLMSGARYDVYYGGVEASEIPFQANLRLEGLIEGGLKRAAVWRKVVPMLPDPETSFELSPNGIPEGEMSGTGDRLLAQLLGDGLTLARLYLELRGQKYAVSVKIAQWLNRGYITAASGYTFRKPKVSQVYKEAMNTSVSGSSETPVFDAPDEVTPETAHEAVDPTQKSRLDASGDEAGSVAPVLAQALVALQEGRLEDARNDLLEVLRRDPSNPLARKRLADIDEKLTTSARGQGLAPERQVILIREPAPEMSLTSEEMFVYSRLAAEPITVETLTQVCPLTETQILQVLMRFISHGLIKIV